jgi:diaminohydroxyphosphoribosylaminopyrimidine deaminase/5-amino-6-(5-phosphoribosylamino)uracil reductase
MRDIRSRVSALPDRSAIIYTALYSDGEGTAYAPPDALVHIAEVANRPIVIGLETYFGRGGAGGMVVGLVLFAAEGALIIRPGAAGIGVETGALAAEAREINIGFFSRMIRKTPWVRLKAAASLDGKTALENGASQWITAEAARADGHAWRARAGAILTGVGTVIEDDPLLDARLVQTSRQPPLVIVDSHLQTPPTARLFEVEREVWIYAAHRDETRAAALEARGATVACLANPHGKVDLAALLRALAAREVNELHVEAGHKLNGSLMREGLADELLLYLAPKFIGEGLGIASRPHAGGALTSLAGALALEFRSLDPIGVDLRILARVMGRDRFH